MTHSSTARRAAGAHACTKSVAQELAAFAWALEPAALPVQVRDKATHHIVDAIGLAFASRHFPFAAPALRGIAAAGAPGSATVIGGARSLAPRDAALANGLLIHGLDFDDTHPLSIVHPTVACLPAALAVAEACDASWDDLLAAYVAGMETAIRLGAAVKGGFHHVGFHATGIVAHFSAAIVAGKLLGLDAAQLTAAQGIAASTAAGVQVFLEEGAWTKRMHPGWGALAGITAAHLAQAGFASPTRPYEGHFGLFERTCKLTRIRSIWTRSAPIWAAIGPCWARASSRILCVISSMAAPRPRLFCMPI